MLQTSNRLKRRHGEAVRGGCGVGEGGGGDSVVYWALVKSDLAEAPRDASCWAVNLRAMGHRCHRFWSARLEP